MDEVKKRGDDFVTTAQVKLVLQINGSSTWGDDCTVDQIRKQAIDEALGKIEKLMRGTGSVLHPQGVEVLGRPEVTVVSFRKERT